VREGRSFSPDEFAIALEQIVAQTAPVDYRDPAQFFSRTCFTRALKEHAGMVLRRLSGKTENTAPVLTLVTQFGGGKTHTLASLYHIANAGADAAKFPGVSDLLDEAGIAEAPPARVGVFVGNAWDPAEGRETPWIDLARQLAGDKGVAALGDAAKTTPPGTGALANVFAAADAPVLLLFDEVLNFVSRHRSMAEPFHAFLQNLTVAVTGTTQAAAVISLPRSQVEMTDWCFERTARLPAEWLAVDTATTETKAREFCGVDLKRAIPFIQRPFRSFSASGVRSPSSSRPEARWPCWHNGFPGPRASSSQKREPSR
jgi:predicted AAA+ superfamily ATPase